VVAGPASPGTGRRKAAGSHPSSWRFRRFL